MNRKITKGNTMKKSVAVLLVLGLCLSLALPAPAEETGETEDTNEYTVGGIVRFGGYEQDNDLGNGEESIEWIVLEADGGRALLISKYCLDARPYNTYTRKITWCRSSLRFWLNYTFIKEAFTVEEREKILATTIVNEKTPACDSYGCDDTTDQIFLLSYAEALAYFPGDAGRRAQPTAYAAANGAYADETTGNGWWWLRSPADGNTSASCIRTDGRVNGCDGREVNRASGSVRPVLWLDTGE
jgi:hypothetical protein